MNKSEYLKQVTSKVFDLKTKKMVTSELEVHIDERVDFFKEIGYDEQASDEKATDAMGEAEDVAVQLGELHNDFYNPIFDIIIFAVILGLLGGAYYILKKYAFCDTGMSSLTLSAVCISFAFMYGYCTLSSIKNKTVPIILSLFTIGAAAVFNYFALVELDKKMGSSMQALIDFIFKTDIPASTNYPNEQRVIIIVCALSFIAALTFIFSLIYHIRVNNLANKRIDNKIIHIFTRLSAVTALISIAFCILFGVKCLYDLNSIKDEYCRAYAYVCEMTEKCDTNDDIIKFVKKGEYPFEESTDANGNITGYKYSHNLVNIGITFEEIKTKAEIREEIKEEIINAADSTIELLKEIYGDSEEMSEAYQKAYDDNVALLMKDIDNNVEGNYLDQCICSISLTSDISYFEHSYDRLSTSFFELQGDEENEFRSCDINKLSGDEEFSFFKKFIPSSFEAEYRVSDINHCAYTFTYIFGSDRYKHTEEYFASRYDEKTAELDSKIDKIIAILKDNPDADSEKTARLTGAKLEKPKYSREELEEQTSVLGSFFDDPKEMAFDMYESQAKYRLDDWYFLIYDKDIYVFTQYGKPFKREALTDTPTKSRIDGGDGQKRVKVDGMYYDKMGYCYKNAEHVPYYTSNGEKLYYYCHTVKDETHTVGDTKEYYITDRDNRFYKPDTCFIDKNGFLCVNMSNLKYDETSKKYKSPNGSEYTKAFETSWDKDGTMLFAVDYKAVPSLF